MKPTRSTTKVRKAAGAANRRTTSTAPAPSSRSPWTSFKTELRPRLDHDRELLRLQDAVKSAPDGNARGVALTRLYESVYEEVDSWAHAHSLPGPPGHYYEDLALASTYRNRQSEIVPCRHALSEYLATRAWQHLQECSRRLPARVPLLLLDLGSGDGEVLRAVLANAPKRFSRRVVMVAAERSSAMLNVHAGFYQESGIARTQGAKADLLLDEWSVRTTYQEIDPAAIDGFHVVLSQQVNHFVPNRDHLYAGIRRLLRRDGLLVFADDFLPPLGRVDRFAPYQTLIDGRLAYKRAHPSRHVTLIGYIAGFIFRRFFLQADVMLSLDAELAIIGRHFQWRQAHTHSTYPEFAVVTAAESPQNSHQVRGFDAYQEGGCRPE